MNKMGSSTKRIIAIIVMFSFILFSMCIAGDKSTESTKSTQQWTDNSSSLPSDKTPTWVWVLFGAAVVTLIIAVVVPLVKKNKSEPKENKPVNADSTHASIPMQTIQNDSILISNTFAPIGTNLSGQ